MSNQAKQISIVDLDAEAIQKPRPTGNVGYTYIDSEGDVLGEDGEPLCKLSLKLSSKTNASWRRIFTAKCEKVFPEKGASPTGGVGYTYIDASGKPGKPEEPSGPSDWFWKVYLDEKALDVIYAESLLCDVELFLKKLNTVINDTQTKAVALDSLIQKTIAPIKEKLKGLA